MHDYNGTHESGHFMELLMDGDYINYYDNHDGDDDDESNDNDDDSDSDSDNDDSNNNFDEEFY